MTDWCETLERIGNHRLVYGSDFISWESKWGHDPAWENGGNRVYFSGSD